MGVTSTNTTRTHSSMRWAVPITATVSLLAMAGACTKSETTGSSSGVIASADATRSGGTTNATKGPITDGTVVRTITTTSNPPSSTAPATDVVPVVSANGITTDGLDPITIGMSLEAFIAATGFGVRPTEGCGPYPIILTGGPDGLDVFFDADKKVRAISVTTPAFLTKSGAGAGTTKAQLLALYPKIEFVPYPGDTAEQYGQYLIATKGRERSVVFSMENGRVKSISVVQGADGFLDLC